MSEMLTAARAVIVAMPLFNVLLIIYGIYRLYRPSTRPAPLLFMLLVRLLTHIDPSDLRRPPEVSLLLQRRRKRYAFHALGAGICGLTLTTICLALGNAAPLSTSPWSSAEIMTFLRFVVMISLGMAGASVGTYIGGGIVRVVGMAHLSESDSAPSTSDTAVSRLADLAPSMLRYSSWVITAVNVVLMLGVFIGIEQYASMRPGQILQTLWPIAIPSLLLALYTVSAETFGRQPYRHLETLSADMVVEEMRNLVPSINDARRRLDLKQVYDVTKLQALLSSQLVLFIVILVPLTRSGALEIAVFSIFVTIAMILVLSFLYQPILPDTLPNDIRAARSALFARVPWRWRSPNAG